TNEMGTWTSEYDAFHRVTETTDPEGNSTSFSYDKLDNQIQMIDGNGNSSTFVYNLLGSLTEQIDAAGYSTYYDYDLLGNRTKLTDPRENSWVTKYDELGRISEEVNSRGGSALYSYDEGSRLSQLVDPNGTVISYLYYDTGLPQTVTYTNEDQDKTQTESYLYDEAGVVISATLDGVVKEYNLVDGEYQPDPMGLISNQTVSFDGKSYSTDFSYDVMNRLNGIGYASGLKIIQSWNSLGQLEEIENYASDFTFNDVGYLESYEQGNGVIAEYDFTDNGLLSSLEYSSGRDSLLSYAYAYDKAGNMTLRNGDAYGYDVKNQLVTASIEGDSLATEESVDYALARHTDDDILGQEEAELVEATVSLDASASSIVIDYTYPKRMSKVIVTPEEIDHRITESTLAVYTSMFNNEGYYSEVEDADISVDDTTGEITVEFESTEYARYLKLHCHFNELNADGSQDTSEASFNISGSDAVQAWALVGGRNEYYIYDGKGNRTTKSIMSDSIYSDEYEYYSDSDLLKFNGTYYYTYDENGNMVEKGTEAEVSGDTVNILSPDELTEEAGEDYAYYSYEYDLKNRLADVDRYVDGELIEVASYTYDIDSYRVSKTDREGLTTDFVFDLSGKILEEVSDETTVQYVFIKERHLARVEEDTTLFYGTDHVNSTVLMTDADGEIVWSGDVSPFGDYSVIDSEEYEALGLKFTGKDMDEDVGLYYFNARWYDADTGRFVTEDPIRDGLNWYGYVSNNPLIYIDPTGLEWTFNEENWTWSASESTDLLIDLVEQAGFDSWEQAAEAGGIRDRYGDDGSWLGGDSIVGLEIAAPLDYYKASFFSIESGLELGLYDPEKIDSSLSGSFGSMSIENARTRDTMKQNLYSYTNRVDGLLGLNIGSGFSTSDLYGRFPKHWGLGEVAETLLGSSTESGGAMSFVSGSIVSNDFWKGYSFGLGRGLSFLLGKKQTNTLFIG
ncbi:MAG: hypothetical protein PQJ60_10920, partial [Spirochaetales bacterium]|nr:hypothetical protein [Spirochaetales bacterium]